MEMRKDNRRATRKKPRPADVLPINIVSAELLARGAQPSSYRANANIFKLGAPSEWHGCDDIALDMKHMMHDPKIYDPDSDLAELVVVKERRCLNCSITFAPEWAGEACARVANSPHPGDRAWHTSLRYSVDYSRPNEGTTA